MISKRLLTAFVETRKAVSDMTRQKSSSALDQSSKFWSNVPGLLTTEFKGRDRELQWMRDALTSTSSTFERRRIGLYGMTGIGKTQLVNGNPNSGSVRCFAKFPLDAQI